MKRILIILLLIIAVSITAKLGLGLGLGLGTSNNEQDDTWYDGATAAWSLAEVNSSGTTIYDLVGSSNGTHNGTLAYTTDQNNVPVRALYGNGIGANEYVDFGSNNLGKFGTSDFTVTVWLNADTDADGDAMLAYGAFNAANCWSLYLVSGYIRVYMSGTNKKQIANFNDGNWHFVVLKRNGNLGYISIDAGTPQSFNMTGIDISANAPFQVGGANSTLPLKGAYSDLAVYPEYKDTTWEAEKYALGQIHGAAPQVYSVPCMGNSILNSGTIPRLNTLLGSYRTATDAAVGGENTTEMIARFTTDVINVSGVKYVLILGGINDVLQGESAVDIEANLATMYAAAAAEGIIVIACKITPCWTYLDDNYGVGHGETAVAKQAVIDDVNTWMDTAINVDYVLDTYTEMEDDVTPDALEVDYENTVNHDHLHLGDVGEQALADFIFANVAWEW